MLSGGVEWKRRVEASSGDVGWSSRRVERRGGGVRAQHNTMRRRVWRRECDVKTVGVTTLLTVWCTAPIEFVVPYINYGVN